MNISFQYIASNLPEIQMGAVHIAFGMKYDFKNIFKNNLHLPPLVNKFNECKSCVLLYGVLPFLKHHKITIMELNKTFYCAGAKCSAEILNIC